MKNLLYWVGAVALAFVAMPAAAQTCATHDANGMCVPATTLVTMAATNAPLAGSVTASTVTPTSGAATFASGTATIGPFTPILGRDIALKLWTTNSAAFSCQEFDSIDGGTTKLPLSIFDTTIGGPYTGPVNSVITSESVAGTTIWLLCTVTSGTLKYWNGQ